MRELNNFLEQSNPMVTIVLGTLMRFFIDLKALFLGIKIYTRQKSGQSQTNVAEIPPCYFYTLHRKVANYKQMLLKSYPVISGGFPWFAGLLLLNHLQKKSTHTVCIENKMEDVNKRSGRTNLTDFLLYINLNCLTQKLSILKSDWLLRIVSEYQHFLSKKINWRVL